MIEWFLMGVGIGAWFYIAHRYDYEVMLNRELRRKWERLPVVRKPESKKEE